MVDFECTGGQFKAIVWRIDKDAEELVRNDSKLVVKLQNLTERAEKLTVNLTVNRLEILKMILEKPTITTIEMAQAIGISSTSVKNNIEIMRDKLIRRVGSDMSGIWDVILE